jgi:hypothetical protein
MPNALKGFLGILALLAGIFALIWFVFLKSMYEEDQLKKHGIEAEGRILSVEETGTYINEKPQIEVRVIVFHRDGGTFESTAVTVMPPTEAWIYRPGTRVRVKYDPDDSTASAIVSAYQGDPGDPNLTPGPPSTVSPGFPSQTEYSSALADTRWRVAALIEYDPHGTNQNSAVNSNVGTISFHADGVVLIDNPWQGRHPSGTWTVRNDSLVFDVDTPFESGFQIVALSSATFVIQQAINNDRSRLLNMVAAKTAPTE